MYRSPPLEIAKHTRSKELIPPTLHRPNLHIFLRILATSNLPLRAEQPPRIIPITLIRACLTLNVQLENPPRERRLAIGTGTRRLIGICNDFLAVSLAATAHGFADAGGVERPLVVDADRCAVAGVMCDHGDG